MNKINGNLLDIGYMDTLACADSLVHRLDPRAKLIATLVFIVMVVSFDKYAISALLPFFVFPVVMISVAGLPARYILRKVLLISPFAILIAICNPFLDRSILFQIGGINISGGWVSFISILLRFFLTVTAALVLVASTGFNAVCLALSKLGLPKPFVMQLLFLYRYIFVLLEETERLTRARALRSFNNTAMKLTTFTSLISHLLLRTLDRAQRIYLAMCCRGFDGNVRLIRPMKKGRSEIIFVAGWSLLFIILRYWNIPLHIGAFIIRRSL